MHTVDMHMHMHSGMHMHMHTYSMCMHVHMRAYARRAGLQAPAAQGCRPRRVAGLLEEGHEGHGVALPAR